MQATLYTKNNDHFDLISVSEFGVDMSEYTKTLSIPYRELKSRDPVIVAEIFIQGSHNIGHSSRWARAGDLFCIEENYYIYADVNDSFLLNDYKLLPSWPKLIIFKTDRNVKI